MAERGGTWVSARLAPPVVSVAEPAAVVAQLSTAQPGRAITVEAYTDGAWLPVEESTAGATGRAAIPVDTSVAGTQRLRVVAEAWNNKPSVTSAPVTLKVTSSGCSEKRLADPDAGLAARCLVARLDSWKAARLMGVGQQIKTSSSIDEANLPLTSLGGRRVSVVGFDLWELGKTKTYQFPFYEAAVANLIAMAADGAVLTASWHAPNPHTGQQYNDRSWSDVGALLRDTPEARAFWADYDAQLAVFAELQAAGVAVVFRPFHEVNGDWFWWGRPNATTFKSLYAEMQRRTWASGIHNVVWAYSFAAANRKGIAAPEKLIPAKVDLAGIDTYYPSTGSHRGQAPSMAGYAAVAKRVPRMAITEIGPAADTNPSTWKASTVTAVARAQVRKPVWALLWVDDPAPKQIASLNGGLAWLDSCSFGFCTT